MSVLSLQRVQRRSVWRSANMVRQRHRQSVKKTLRRFWHVPSLNCVWFVFLAADWYPRHVEVQQEGTLVTVTFNLAPPNLGIRNYFSLCYANGKKEYKAITPVSGGLPPPSVCWRQLSHFSLNLQLKEEQMLKPGETDFTNQLCLLSVFVIMLCKVIWSEQSVLKHRKQTGMSSWGSSCCDDANLDFTFHH